MAVTDVVERALRRNASARLDNMFAPLLLSPPAKLTADVATDPEGRRNSRYIISQVLLQPLRMALV